jgi:hypothetical protein
MPSHWKHFSVGKETIRDTIDPDVNRHIGTSDGAQPASDASRLFHDLRVEIALRIYLTRHTDNLLRAGANTQFAAFAPILFYLN